MRWKTSQKSNAPSPCPAAEVRKAIRRKYQKTTQLTIPRSTFARLLRQVSAEIPAFRNCGFRWSECGTEALQKAAEHYMVGLFEDSYFCVEHARRQTLYVKDMDLARRIRGRFEDLQHVIHLS